MAGQSECYKAGPMPRVAVINTHPIQHFAPLWAAVNKLGGLKLKVFYCTDWGVKEYADPGFGKTFRWDVDLLSGYDFEFLPIARRPQDLSFRQVNNALVGERLSAFGPDVLVLFGYGTLTNWRALFWARRHGIRVLLYSDSERKHFRPWAVRAAKEVIVRAFFWGADGAMPVGNCNADYYRHYGLTSDILYPCPLPVDGDRFGEAAQHKEELRAGLRNELGIGEDEFVFASVGKYIARKRHGDCIAAFSVLPEALRERSRLLLIGDGPERAGLEELAARANTKRAETKNNTKNTKILFSGFVNQSRMPSFFAASDALIVASEHDPHPLVVTEALFFGLPVIASDQIGCIGPDDTLRPGQNGLVVPCGDIHAMAQAMQCLMDEKEQYNRFSEESKKISISQDTKTAARCFETAVRNALALPLASPASRFSRLLQVNA